MPEDAAGALARAAQAVAARPALLEHFTALHEQYVLRGEYRDDWSPHPVDPAVEADFGRESALFYLLVYMSGLPRAEEGYRRLDIGPEIFDATFYDITFYLLEPSRIRGYWTFNEFGWIPLHLRCQLFRLGRLQFALKEYEDHAQAFRSRATGAYRLLCGPGLNLRADGAMVGAGGPEAAALDAGETWQTVFEEHAEGWWGHPIAPRGCALRQPELLPRAEWERCLTQGDTVLDVHIPRGANLTAADCRDSFCQAYEFFPSRWPERKIQAAYCHTWFFTPQLQTFLPKESSIVRFQREFYLYPYAGGPGFLWRFVFGEAYPERATAPRDTHLRRAALDWLAAGQPIYDLPGLRFHSPEEWGSQPYMTAWGE